MARGRKIVPEDDFIPSSDDDQSESEAMSEGEEEEEYEEEQENTDDESNDPPPPPSTKTSQKMKRAASSIQPAPATPIPSKRVKRSDNGGDEKKSAIANTSATNVGKGSKKTLEKKEIEAPAPAMDKIKFKRKGSSNDFEIQMDKNTKVTDMSISGPKFPRDKILLDDRYWARIATVNYKSKGVTFEQFFIGRDPAKGDVGKDGGVPKPFQMGMPIRCLEPLRLAINFLTNKKSSDVQETA